MSDTYQIHIMRKGNQTLTTISDAPVKEVYAMLYSAVELVAKNTNQSVESTLGVLSDLNKFVKKSE